MSDRARAIIAERSGGAFPVRPMPDTVSAVSVPSHAGDACRAIVVASGVRLLVNGGTPRRIPASLIEAVPAGVLNVHPGILPGYRGANACEWAILNDDPVGLTAHFMDRELDGGPIIYVRELPIARGQNYSDVRVALYRSWVRTVVEATASVLERGLRSDMLSPQPPSPVRRPMPDQLLAVVKRKLESGDYARAT